MVEDLLVIGAGGFGREALDVVDAINSAAGQPVWRVVGVADDSPSELNLTRLTERGTPYLGRVSDVLRNVHARTVVGIGSPRSRNTVADVVAESGARPATLLHPTAVIGSRVQLGPGTVICAGVSVGTNVRIGDHAHLNAHTVVGHDTHLGDYVSVNPNATISGECGIGDQVLVGAGAVVLQGLRVGRQAVVAAGACVVRDVCPGSTVKGVPAR